MKKLICGLVMSLGLSFSCHAQGMKISQYPNTNNLAGTNLFLIAIVGSPGTNMNISYAQLSNLLAAAIGGGGGGAQVWTNDGTYTFLSGTHPTNAAPFFFRNEGSLFAGTNVWIDGSIDDYTVHYMPWSISIISSNEPQYQMFGWLVIDSGDWNSDCKIIGDIDNGLNTGSSVLTIKAKTTNGIRTDIVLSAFANSGPFNALDVMTNLVSLFSVDGVSGNIVSKATNFVLGCTDGVGSWFVGIKPDGTIVTRTNTSP